MSDLQSKRFADLAVTVLGFAREFDAPRTRALAEVFCNLGAILVFEAERARDAERGICSGFTPLPPGVIDLNAYRAGGVPAISSKDTA